MSDDLTKEESRVMRGLRQNPQYPWKSRATVLTMLSPLTSKQVTATLDGLVARRLVAVRVGPYGMRGRKITQYRITPL